MATNDGVLVLLRHGESTFNASQTFTGLLDADLTAAGEHQVGIAAHLLADADLHPTLLVTSPMLRAARTAELLFGHLGEIPETILTWRLVERDYGCLTRVSKADARERHGEDAFFTWRRTMHGRPPAASEAQRASWTDPPPVPDSGPLTPGCGESLADVVARVEPVWREVLVPRLRAGETVAVVSHGNTLRGLVTVMEHLSDTAAEQLNIPAGHPLVYRLASDGTLSEGAYLDEESAAVATAAVAAEGGT